MLFCPAHGEIVVVCLRAKFCQVSGPPRNSAPGRFLAWK